MKVDVATQIITRVAGVHLNCTFSPSPAGVASTTMIPFSVAVDSGGNMYILENEFLRVLRVDAISGDVTIVAGTGRRTGSIDGEGGDARDDLGDGGPAVDASFDNPLRVRVDSSDNVYIVDAGNERVRRINMLTGVITTVAGGGTGGDGGLATNAQLSSPGGVAFGAGGDMLVVEASGVRTINAVTGVIGTIAGTGAPFSPGATSPEEEIMGLPDGVLVDAAGNVYTDSAGGWLRRLNAAGDAVTTVIGDPNQPGGFSGDGGLAADAQFSGIGRTAFDSNGNLFLVDTGNNRIRRVDAGTGVVTTVAGNGSTISSGDNGPATSAGLGRPTGVAVDSLGNVFVADRDGNSVRRVDAGTGIITQVSSATRPVEVAVGSGGFLFVVESGNGGRLFQVNLATGSTTIIAGGFGNAGNSSDGIPAIEAELLGPSGIFVDPDGNIYIALAGESRVRRVESSTGIITTVAGNGVAGLSGDGGSAVNANLNAPSDIFVDGQGNFLYIADRANNRIRRVGLNIPPTASPQAVATDEDTDLVVTMTGSDTEGETLTFTVATPPMRGTLSSITFVNGTTSRITYAPDQDFNGGDSFEVVATDARGISGTPATISVTIVPVNDAPTADDLTGGVDANTAANTLTLTGSDVEGDSLTFSIDTVPGNGTLSAVSAVSATSGSVDYTPNADFAGIDSFTYLADDTNLPSFPGVFTVEVRGPVPTMGLVSPFNADAGSADFTLTVTGTNFVSNSEVHWNGSPRTTTFISNSELEAAITSADLTTGDNAAVMVVNPSPGGGPTVAFSVFFVDDYTFAVAAGSMGTATVAGGQTAQFALTVTPTSDLPAPLGSFDQPVAFSCSGLPRDTTCAFSPAQVTPGLQPANVTLTVSTTILSLMPPLPHLPHRIPPSWPYALLVLGLFLLLLTGVRFAEQRGPVVRRVVVASVATMLLLLAACGSGNKPPTTGTPLGTHTITVTATSGSFSQITTVNLTVQ